MICPKSLSLANIKGKKERNFKIEMKIFHLQCEI